MQKAKRNTPAILDNFWVKSTEFTSEFSVDECADRLARRNEPRGCLLLYRNNLQIKVNYDHQDTLYTFTMKRDAGRNLIVTAQGSLHAIDDHHTSVYIKAQQSRFLYAFLSSLGVVFLCLVLVSPQQVDWKNVTPPGIIASVAVFLVLHFTLINARNELIRVVEDTLAP